MSCPSPTLIHGEGHGRKCLSADLHALMREQGHTLSVSRGLYSRPEAVHHSKMTNAVADAQEDPPTGQPYVLQRPDESVSALPILLTSPHSGTYYPDDFSQASRLQLSLLRRAEDAFVDRLIVDGPTKGMTILTACYARSYVDVNRHAAELDPQLFEETLHQNSEKWESRDDSPGDRALVGLGVIPRVVGPGLAIYDRRLPRQEVRLRLDAAYHPWHRVLADELSRLHALHGYVILLDWHSMPTLALHQRRMAGKTAAQVVLGDRWGTACHPVLTQQIADSFAQNGLRVGYNDPYAGGHITQHHGQPTTGVHALQVELDRSLYMDEGRVELNAGFAALRHVIEDVLTQLGGSLPQLAKDLLPKPTLSTTLAAE